MNASKGLEDVVAAETAIATVDGQAGELRYRGYPIGELVERYSFEGVAHLLWFGELPSPAEERDLKEELRALRLESWPLVERLRDVPAAAHPLDVLRFIVSRDAIGYPLAWDNSPDANMRKAKEMTAWLPVVVAAFHRLAAGEKPVAPPPDLDTAACFLVMLHGRHPADVAVRTLDTSLILHAEHELNASTFAARVTIATQSNLHAAIASALGTLAGPRHGGASDRVIAMLEEIGSPDRAESYVRDLLARRERVMGFGHRVYRTVDPRSRHLRAMAEAMVRGTEHEVWGEILAQLSEIMRREKNLYPNVDLYAAVVNHELGIAPAFYTSVFACSRVVGWTAHAMEQLDARMIRPLARYVGPAPRRVPEGSAV